ncbi:hypothetical protein RVR_7415 [Actinacidiphila reveromycinica]|uniref:Uncharacterized protein n=1 Tax=Actinacidiphila reveromycinica TaxID=659352 RepID=A0A7U3UX74_9ACTN|nr:hypothetical protein RVR_7415 [Streptomyces sp. SN-593]
MSTQTKSAAKNTGPATPSDKGGKSKKGTYLSIGTSLFSAFSAVKKVRAARSEDDKLQLVDAVLRAAAVTTGIVLLVRELRRLGDDDVLAD